MAEQEGQEKTEVPTEKKRRESREEGQVAFSKELSSAALLAGIVLTLVATSPIILDAMRQLMSQIFRDLAQSEELSIDSIFTLSGEILSIILPAFAPFAAVIIFVGIFASVLQVGVLITFKAIAPKFNKISPLTGLKRLFSSQSLADFLKSMAKLIIVGFVGYLTYIDKITELNGLSVSSALPFPGHWVHGQVQKTVPSMQSCVYWCRHEPNAAPSPFYAFHQELPL